MARYVFLDGVLTEVPYARDLPRPPATFPMIQRDLPAYKSPLGDGWVDGRAARREHLKRTGCREVDPSEFRPTAWNPDFAARHGLQHEAPPPTPEHVRKWREDKLAVRDNPRDLNKPAPPEVVRAAAEQAIRTAALKE